MTGATAYPSPEKGYLEQDAEIMLAFEVLDEIQNQREEEKERIAQMREKTKQHFSP